MFSSLSVTRGDIKVTQVDMIMEGYSYILDEDRKVKAPEFDIDSLITARTNGSTY